MGQSPRARRSLKSESFKYITRTVPYETADAPQVLTAKVDELSQMTSGILAETLSKEEREANARRRGGRLDDYIARRVRDQIRQVLPDGDRASSSVRAVARVIAVVLGVLAVVISAAGGMSESSSIGTAVAALLGVVTTTGAAVASWFQRGNHLENALELPISCGEARAAAGQARCFGGRAQSSPRRRGCLRNRACGVADEVASKCGARRSHGRRRRDQNAAKSRDRRSAPPLRFSASFRNPIFDSSSVETASGLASRIRCRHAFVSTSSPRANIALAAVASVHTFVSRTRWMISSARRNAPSAAGRLWASTRTSPSRLAR